MELCPLDLAIHPSGEEQRENGETIRGLDSAIVRCWIHIHWQTFLGKRSQVTKSLCLAWPGLNQESWDECFGTWYYWNNGPSFT